MDANRLSLDPALASQIIESLGQELKAVKQRLTEAEERHEASALDVERYRARAHAAENENGKLQRTITALEGKIRERDAEVDRLSALIDKKHGISSLPNERRHEGKMNKETDELGPARIRELEEQFARQRSIHDDEMSNQRETIARLKAENVAKTGRIADLQADQARYLEENNILGRSNQRNLAAVNRMRRETAEFKIPRQHSSNSYSSAHAFVDFSSIVLNLANSSIKAPQEALQELPFLRVPEAEQIVAKNLCVPGGVLHISDRHVHIAPHYYIFGPSHHYDTATNIWVKNPASIGLTKDVLILPKGRKKSIYAGTFKSVALPDMTLDQYYALTSKNQTLLANLVIGEGNSHPLTPIIRDLCKAGIFRIECVGLQYVGYNRALFNYLAEESKGDARKAAPAPAPVAIPTNGTSKRKNEARADDRQPIVKKMKGDEAAQAKPKKAKVSQ